MVAAHDRKEASGIGKLSLFDLLYPGAVNTDGYLMLRLASGGTGMTTNALAVVDYESVFHVELLIS